MIPNDMYLQEITARQGLAHALPSITIAAMWGTASRC